MTDEGSTHSLKAIYQSTVWPVLELAHDVGQADEVPDVNSGFVLERIAVRCWVEIDEMGGASGRLQVRHKAIAESRFSGSSGSSDYHCVTHHWSVVSFCIGVVRRWEVASVRGG